MINYENSEVMKLYNKVYEVFEKNFLMYAMFGVLLASSLGAAGAMLTFYSSEGIAEIVQISLLVIGACGFTAALLGGKKSKTVFNWLLISVIISLVVVLIQIL